MAKTTIVNKGLAEVHASLVTKLAGQKLARHGKHRVIRLNDDGSVTVIFYKTEIMVYHADGRLEINCFAEVKGRMGAMHDGTQATAVQFEKAINEVTDETVLMEYNSDGPVRYSTMMDAKLPKGVTLVNNER